MGTLSSITAYVNYELIIMLLSVPVVLFLLALYTKYRQKHGKLKSIEGKLTRKVKDLRDEERNVQNIVGTSNLGLLHRWRNEEDTTRYYLTFKTEKGMKSFTVSEKVFKSIKRNQKGIITMKGKKFISFKNKK
ncbi:DUF2500 domain-containing protein [Candidatus Izimaplasma bacterium]|nr:DUF2500 domain-containing protein [Candidatus Izimaplasma bacterium]